jgi:hypothetical protein
MRLGFVVLALFPTIAFAQTICGNTMSVSANKISRIAPDRASMYVLAEGTAETPADAVARTETKPKSVTDAIRALGSRAEFDRPITYNVGTVVQRGSYLEPVNPLPNVSLTGVRVYVNRVDQIASVARADAQALVAALGGSLGGLVDLSGNANDLGFVGPQTLNFDSRFMQPDVSAGTVESTSSGVRYRLERSRNATLRPKINNWLPPHRYTFPPPVILMTVASLQVN